MIEYVEKNVANRNSEFCFLLVKCLKFLLLITLLITGLLLSPISAQADESEDKEAIAFMTMMNKYLTIAQRWAETADNPKVSAYLAIEGMFENYEARDELPAAAEHFERLLKQTPDNRTLRTLIHFKLRDIYIDLDKPKKSLEHLRAIYKENNIQ